MIDTNPVKGILFATTTNQKDECVKWLNEMKLIQPDIIFNKSLYPSSYVYIDKPYIVNGSYKNLDDDKDIIKQVVKYYYYKILQYWMTNSYIDLLGYLKIDGDNVNIITKKEDYSALLDNSSDTHKKIAYLQEHILTKRHIYKWLKKYVKNERTKWYKLQNDESSVKKYIHTELKKILTKYDN
jgi:hypothetical protein